MSPAAWRSAALAIAFTGAGASATDEQVAAVVNYIRSHFGNSYPDSVSSADVRLARP